MTLPTDSLTPQPPALTSADRFLASSMSPDQSCQVVTEHTNSTPTFYIREELIKGETFLIYKGYLPTFAFSDPDRMEAVILNTRGFIEEGRKLAIQSLVEQGLLDLA